MNNRYPKPPQCPDGWYAVYPCGSKMDLCASYEDRPVAFFQSKEFAYAFATNWKTSEVFTSEEADSKPTEQTF